MHEVNKCTFAIQSSKVINTTVQERKNMIPQFELIKFIFS